MRRKALNLKKKIEFFKHLEFTGELLNAEDSPSQWENIELISRGYASRFTSNDFDVMFAYDDDRSQGCLFIGKFNDGVV